MCFARTVLCSIYKYQKRHAQEYTLYSTNKPVKTESISVWCVLDGSLQAGRGGPLPSPFSLCWPRARTSVSFERGKGARGEEGDLGARARTLPQFVEDQRREQCWLAGVSCYEEYSKMMLSVVEKGGAAALAASHADQREASKVKWRHVWRAVYASGRNDSRMLVLQLSAGMVAMLLLCVLFTRAATSQLTETHVRARPHSLWPPASVVPETILSDVFISVKTSQRFHRTRLRPVLDTWFQTAKRETWFFTDGQDEELQRATGEGDQSPSLI